MIKLHTIPELKKYIGKKILCKKEFSHFKEGEFYLLGELRHNNFHKNINTFDYEIDDSVREVTIMMGMSTNKDTIPCWNDSDNPFYMFNYDTSYTNKASAFWFMERFEVVTIEEVRKRKIKSVLK